MAGGALKYRHLNRTSSHRQALLRNLVTSLITHESIQTTWHKAKEAQRLAEKLITLGKKNTNASRAKAEAIFYEPQKHLPTLFTTLRQRYLHRPGGYTRVLRIEPLNHHHDQAPSAILELVDGPRDMRFAMTAKTLVRERAAAAAAAADTAGDDDDEAGGGRRGERGGGGGGGIRDITARNVVKVTRFRPGGEEELERTVRRLETMAGLNEEGEGVGLGEKEKKKREERRKKGEGREAWEPFARMRRREREEEDEGRALTVWEKRETRRVGRDPDSGRRIGSRRRMGLS